MDEAKLTLSILPKKLAICRLEKNSTIPFWATDSTFFSITKTEDELSIVCPENKVPPGVISEKNWRAFKVMGPLDFSLTGILASLANALDEAKINLLVPLLRQASNRLMVPTAFTSKSSKGREAARSWLG